MNLTIFADIPKNCYFTIFDENGTYFSITDESINNHQISFDSVEFFINFVSYNDSAKWTGFLVVTEGYRISPPNDTIINVVHKQGGLEEWLIIGLSSVGLIVAIVVVGLITRHQLKKRYKKFDQLCNVLKDMRMSPEEIVEMKEKSDELLILPNKIHINFDYSFGQGSSSTVYKGHLMGTAPLHLIEKSIVTQRFMDCDVAVKVATHFGPDEVDQLFKEIDAMKKIGYHENVMCMLGWALPGDAPCLVYDIAEMSVLSFVSDFREKPDDEVPCKKFLSILWQVSRGMQYIASKGIIHRSLSARNILLFGPTVAKISYFTNCCFCSSENFTVKASAVQKLSAKSMALESLTEKIFSEKSDIWAFGILAHEMFIFGKAPYEALNDDEILEFLNQGNRLERPSNVNEQMYEIIMGCWNADPDSRPTFKALEKTFFEIVEVQNELYGYVQSKIYSI
uniref:Protein kinase domain-containing protein n=1 Tax=Acrobeloides nanus TaxID=290746 RepID=A0A914D7A2_9BILA